MKDFLGNFEGTVIVVSHDRHFLNMVCTTNMLMLTLEKSNYTLVTMISGMNQVNLALQMAKDQNKKKEEKIKELTKLHC